MQGFRGPYPVGYEDVVTLRPDASLRPDARSAIEREARARALEAQQRQREIEQVLESQHRALQMNQKQFEESMKEAVRERQR